MNYYLDLFSPETYEAFSKSSRGISGFRTRQTKAARRIQPGDRFLCYMTRVSRWIGVLEVTSDAFNDDTPIFYPQDDPFILRFKVKPIVWLQKENTVPIHEDEIWNRLSATKDHSKTSKTWTGKFRGSLVLIDRKEGEFLEQILVRQATAQESFPLDEEKYRRSLPQRIQRAEKTVVVTVPEVEKTPLATEEETEVLVRESIKIQAMLANIGHKMGFTIWLPKHDRRAVIAEWKPDSNAVLERLPLNYDDVTLKTIEQIDVLWLKGRSIVRAFEIEHTTAVYSGILRMADLMALQPNMDIKIHIVAPDSRKDKVFQEILRPVFSLLERGALSELCTFISYESVQEVAELEHLSHLSDSVWEEYEEEAE